MDPATAAPAAAAPTTSTPAAEAPPLDHGAFPPPKAKVDAMAKLAAIRGASAKPSPFDAPNPIASPAPAAAKPGDNPAATATPKVEAKPADAPKIEMDAGTLKRLTALAKADRENKQKIAQLEGSAKDTATLAEAKKLYSEGKRMEAIAKLSGASDGVAEMEALMADYLNAPTTDAKDDARDALAAKVDELSAWKTGREKAEAQAAETQRNAQVAAFANSVLDAAKQADGSLMFEICARPENRGEAAEAALAIVTALAIDRGLTQDANGKPRDVTRDEVAALYREAYQTVEGGYAELGARYSKRGNPQPSSGQHQSMSRPPTAIQPQTRPTPTIPKSPIATSPTGPQTIEQHKARALEAMRGLRA